MERAVKMIVYYSYSSTGVLCYERNGGESAPTSYGPTNETFQTTSLVGISPPGDTAPRV